MHPRIVVESDSKGVIELILSHYCCLNELGSVLEDNGELSNSVEVVFNFIPVIVT